MKRSSPPRSCRAVVGGVAVAAVAGVGAACRPAPVVAFEDFYAATVAGDAAAVRARLCGEARAALVGVDDGALAAALAVATVVRRTEVAPGPPAADGAVGVIVEDAVGARTTVRVRPDGQAPGGWCVLGLAPSPTGSPP